ncbi:uncharacterized protein LY79DRAFT_580933 [Colletotrichum navitas]|uniref:Glycoside hydrolase 131 catalytic N-terminal domain-containing protein n=1 Tax=Colletotrichum navitas TaxID=681940 RepID=A0AAD8V1M3_9PEZI|nr:uncharacterized protein LY79DRAFT_580933 [Colletotrichum navitas]KAK1585501.1 hypothetical protein LY79DRAFT_580933 [Colletotrichum navitas]
MALCAQNVDLHRKFILRAEFTKSWGLMFLRCTICFFHLSAQRDATKPLNATHDYQIVSLELKNFSFHQFDVCTGANNGNEIAIFGDSKATPPEKIFSLSSVDGQFENFAMKLDFNAKYVLDIGPERRALANLTGSTAQVFYSTVQEPLPQATYTASLWQKNPVGDAPQPEGIQQALILGSISMEDSTDGMATLR